MRQDAIAAANADFQFKPFDLDGDGRVMANELDINICIPQTSTFGQAEEMGTYQVDGTTLKIETLDCYFGPNSDRNLAVGTIAHENSHQTLNAYDLYGPEIPPMPDKLTLMGDTNQPIHLSGYEKLHHGWIAPSVIDVTQWTTQTVRLDPIETSQQAILIYDPTRGHDDYFLIENRSTSTTLGITNYDSNVVGSAGLVLWHIVKNPAFAQPEHSAAGALPARLAARDVRLRRSHAMGAAARHLQMGRGRDPELGLDRARPGDPAGLVGWHGGEHDGQRSERRSFSGHDRQALKLKRFASRSTRAVSVPAPLWGRVTRELSARFVGDPPLALSRARHFAPMAEDGRGLSCIGRGESGR